MERGADAGKRHSPETLCRQYEVLKGERSQFERGWQDIADYMRPMRAEFTTMRSPGEIRNQKVFDSTPLRAVDHFAGGMYGMMTNPSNVWFQIRLQDEELNEFGPVRDWLEDVQKRMVQSFEATSSQFYASAPTFYGDLACFGNAVHYSEEGEGFINDLVRPLSECVWSEGAFGRVDTLYRKFKLTGRQAAAFFGWNNLHQKMKQMIEKNEFGSHEFLHAVYPNTDDKFRDKMGPTARPFLSCYVDEANRHEVKAGGYWDFPYQVTRWGLSAGEMYGRGLGEQNIFDVKMLNRMVETTIRAAQKAADPPLVATDEGAIKQARTWPGGVTYGGIGPNGEQYLRPLMTGANINISLEMVDRQRELVKEGFYFSLMQMFQQGQMTATEWTGRQEEKLRLLGPNLGRVQSEFLSPLIARRFGILYRTDRLPPPPREAQGASMRIEYVSPLARAQKVSESNAVLRTYQGLGMIAQAEPSVLDNLDHDKAARILAEGFGVPLSIIRDKDDVAQVRQQRAASEGMGAALGAAETGSKVVKQLADASKSGAQAVQAQEGGGGNVVQLIEQLKGAIKGR